MRAVILVGIQLWPVAHCQEQGCRFALSSSRSTRRLAQEHVRATGHEVLCVAEKRTLYGPQPTLTST